MLSASSALQTALYSSSGIGVAECLTVYLASGTQRWTNYGSNLTYGSETWTAKQVGWNKGKTVRAIGTSVDSMELELFGTATVDGVNLVAAAASLAFDGIRAVVSRIYFATAGGSAIDLIVMFDGRIQRTAPTTGGVTIEIQSTLSLTPVSEGTRIIQTSCPFSVNDTDCAASVLEYNTTTTSGCTVTRVYLSSIGSYAQVGSRITFTSGALSGVVAEVRTVGSTYVDLVGSLASAPATGVSVTVRRQCDKTRSVCRDVFSNIARYGGCPELPVKDLLP